MRTCAFDRARRALARSVLRACARCAKFAGLRAGTRCYDRAVRTRAIVFACALGCGRIGFHLSGDDGGTGDGMTADAMMTTNSVCPQTVALTDDFTSATTLPVWTPFLFGSNMTYAQGGRQLVLAFRTRARSTRTR
jgi:hypothetical protein